MTQNFRREERALVNRVSRRLNFVPARCDYYYDDDNFCIVGASSILNRVSLSLSLFSFFLSLSLSLSLSLFLFSLLRKMCKTEERENATLMFDDDKIKQTSGTTVDGKNDDEHERESEWTTESRKNDSVEWIE